MKSFFTFFDDQSALFIEVCSGKYPGEIGDLLIVYGYAALLDQTTSLGTVLSQFGVNQKGDQVFSFL